MESLERRNELAKEYDERFEIFQDDIKQWEETDERKASVLELRDRMEAEFPETKKDREDRERCDRAERLRGEDERAMIARRLADEKVRKGVASVPRLLTESERKIDKGENGREVIVSDMKKAHHLSVLESLRKWTPEERELFKSRAVEHVKIFHGLSKFFINKTPADLVLYYYYSKKKEHYKKEFKARKRSAKYKVAPFPSKEELAYLRLMPALDYEKYPTDTLMCCFCCKHIDGLDLKGIMLPPEAYDVWALNPEEERAVCSRCRDEMTKMYKTNQCPGNRCSAKKKTQQRRSVPPDLIELPIRTRSFVMDQIGVPRVAIRLCAACRNYVNKMIGDIHAKDPGILDELSRYEGQVGWTEQEKTKLVALINASSSLDWDAISAGMSRRPNECRVQYDSMNGNKGITTVMDDGDDDVEALPGGADDISEIHPPVLEKSTPTTSTRRSGLARSVKKAPKTPRAPRSNNRRTTGGAVTRAQRKPVVEDDEMEEMDEEASNTSGGKSGSKAPSDNDNDSTSPQEAQDAEDDSSGAAEDEDEEMPTAARDEPMSPKTLIEKPVILSPKVLIQRPDFTQALRNQKPSTSTSTSTSSAAVAQQQQRPAIPEIVHIPDDSDSNSPQIVEDDEEEEEEEEEENEDEDDEVVAVAAPQPKDDDDEVVVVDDDDDDDVEVVDDDAGSKDKVEIDLGKEEEEEEGPPAKKKAATEEKEQVEAALQAPPTSVPQPSPAQPEPVQLAQPTAVIASPAPAPPPIIHTPTPVRPNAASTPSSISGGAGAGGAGQPATMDPAMLNLLKQQQQSATYAALLMQQQQQQQQQHAIPGSLTAGTPFQQQQQPAAAAMAQQQGALEQFMRVLQTSGVNPLLAQNPDLLKMVFQVQLQQQAQLQQQQQQANPLLYLQHHSQFQAAQLQAQAQAQAQALAAQEAKAKEAQARVQAHQTQAAQAAALQSRISAASVQMPIGINTAYQKSLTPSSLEPRASATPPVSRPRAATTIGATKAQIQAQMQQAQAAQQQEISPAAMAAKLKNLNDLLHLDAKWAVDEQDLLKTRAHLHAIGDIVTVAKIEQVMVERMAEKTKIKQDLENAYQSIAQTILLKPDLMAYDLDTVTRKLLTDLMNNAPFLNRLKVMQEKNNAAAAQQQQIQAQQMAMLRQMTQQGQHNPIGIRHPNQYPGVAQQQAPPQQAHPQQQQQQPTPTAQKRKMANSMKRGAAIATSSSSSASAQASPAPTTAANSGAGAIGIHPHNLAVLQQQQQRAAAEKDQQAALLQQHMAIMQHHYQQAQAQAAHQAAQQQSAPSHPQQDLKSKRKSGIESITSMQTATTPNRHVQLAGPSARMQGGRGVSPALSTGSRGGGGGGGGQASTSGRSITAGTSGHSLPTSSAEFSKEMSDVMNQINKPGVSSSQHQHQQLQHLKTSAAAPSNAVSPAGSSHSDDVVFLGTQPSTARAAAPVPPKPTAPMTPKTAPAKVLKQQMLEQHPRRTLIPSIQTEEEANECIVQLIQGETKLPPGEQFMTIFMRELEKQGKPMTAIGVYTEFRKADEERLRKMAEEEEKAKQQYAMQFNKVIEEIRHWQTVTAGTGTPHDVIINQFVDHMRTQGIPDNVLNRAITQFVQQLAQQQQQQQQVPPTSAPQPVAQPQSQAQPQQPQRPDNYEKFQLLRPHVIRPIPTTGSPFEHHQHLQKPPQTPSGPSTSSGAAGAGVPSQLTPRPSSAAIHPMPSPSVAVQTATATSSASLNSSQNQNQNQNSTPAVGNPSSVQSMGISDLSSDEDEMNGVLPKNRIPPGKDSKQLLSIIDYRALGLVPCPYFEFDEENIPSEPRMIVRKLFSTSIRQPALLYEELSDDE